MVAGRSAAALLPGARGGGDARAVQLLRWPRLTGRGRGRAEGQQIGDSVYYVRPTTRARPTEYQIYNATTGQDLGDSLPEGDELRNLVASLEHITSSRIRIDDQDRLIEGMLRQYALGAITPAELWGEEILETAYGPDFDATWQQQTGALAALSSRVVPAATASFYRAVRFARQCNDLTAWRALVDAAEDDESKYSVVGEVKGASGATFAFVQRLLSIGEVHQLLAGPDGPRRDQLLAKMLREARDLDVWHFVRPAEVARVIDRLRRRIGRRHAFWSFLIDGWRTRGLLGA